MLSEVLPEICSTPYLLARALVMFDMEAAGGLRVGEATGGGDGHGALAGLVDIAVPIDGGETTINVHLEDSKTGFPRDATYVSETKGELQLECEKNLRELWRLSGFTLRHWEEDGMSMVAPDYYVVRVSLLDMQPADFKRFCTIIGNQTIGPITELRSSIVWYAEQRYAATTISQEERYVNIAGGARDVALR